MDLGCEDDLGVYLGDWMVDVIFYNICCECCCEFIVEGMCWDDLKRWCFWDWLFMELYIVEGINFWDEVYKFYIIVDKDGNEKFVVVVDGSMFVNMLLKLDGKYVWLLCRI